MLVGEVVDSFKRRTAVTLHLYIFGKQDFNLIIIIQFQNGNLSSFAIEEF